METIKLSSYQNKEDKNKIDIDLSYYIDVVKNGKYQDIILKARSIKNDEKLYKQLKNEMPCVTGSAVMNQGSKVESNIKELNGLIVIDIDDEVDIDTITKINNDKYTFISHRSFGGDGVCIFVKINPNKFLESFNDLGQYYWDNFNLTIDPSCKNKNRLRFFSYDPYLFYNESAKKFIAKSKIEKPKHKENFIFVQDDFTQVLEKLSTIDLCQDDYQRYVNIGFAIGSEFGESGLNYFKAICQNGSKYDPKNIERHYKNFCKKGNITISTFYHYVKEQGIEIYSDKTKKTITTVASQKAQGTPTIESVKKHITEVLKIDNPDEDLIKKLIESNVKYHVENEETEVNQLKNFIKENFNPIRDSITNENFINKVVLDDTKLNSIYFSCKNCLPFGVSKSDVRDMINSEATETFNPLNEFFKVKEFESGLIEKYINCVKPESEYNIWAFKKWIVGCVHNWLAPINEPKVSPLTLVLCGQKQGTGKTSFFRNLLPPDLQKYLIEHKIDSKDKDSVYNLVKGLLVLDDEFGGLATRDVKDFKKIADANQIDIRLPYSAFYSKMKRRASLCGTSNESDVLKDVTGNRRILPINVESIDYDTMIKIDTDSLWREVFKIYRENSFDWKIYSSEDFNYLEENTKKNIEIMPVEELFFSRFSIEKTEVFTEYRILNQGEIMNYINATTATKINKFELKDIFTKNKLVYKNHKTNLGQKKGVILYAKYQNTEENTEEVPF
jgi:predicted P-loop ATPase